MGRDQVVVDLACGYGEFIASIQARRKIGVDLNPNYRAHLPADVEFINSRADKECDAAFNEVRRILKPGGRFVIMGPNIGYLAVEEGLAQAGFVPETVIDKFLPYTTRSALPKGSALIALYLHVPIVWRVLGKQFLVVGRKP